MIRSLVVSIFFIFITAFSYTQFKTADLMTSNTTPTYEEMVEFFQQYAAENDDIALYNMGLSDYGLPIYLCVLNADQDSLKTMKRAKNEASVLINNAIHPGEPCGINAVMQVVIEYSNMPTEAKKDFPLTGIIPAYNIGGMKNRNGYSRANQEGPEEYGFRGNAQNLDLNRDFIKMDSKNAWVFAKIYHAIDPEVFIDTHTTNGADYQYVMTYIVPLYDRMPASTREMLFSDLLPYLEENMPKKWNYDLIPYVVSMGKTPDDGISAFNSSPRYAMGYADLFNSISFTTETHMLKPYTERVRATYAFIVETLAWTMSNKVEVKRAREKAFEEQLKSTSFFHSFEPDTTFKDSIFFKGFGFDYIKSSLTAQDRLKYDRTKPYEKYIPHQFRFKSNKSIKAPDYYIIGGQEEDVIERLSMNNINFSILENDSIIEKAKRLKVNHFSANKSPYEGHFWHKEVSIDEKSEDHVKIKRGDIIVPVNQRNKLFLVSVLEPEMEDSYFRWNFFDSYLMQKEYFSPYIFEDIAVKFLAENPSIEKEYRAKQKSDEEFASNRWEQLYWIYKRSPHFESSTLKVLPIIKVYN